MTFIKYGRCPARLKHQVEQVVKSTKTISISTENAIVEIDSLSQINPLYKISDVLRKHFVGEWPTQICQNC